MKIAARLLFLFSFLFLFFLLPSDSLAQRGRPRPTDPALKNTDLAKPNQNWQCLDLKKVPGGHTVELSVKTSNMFPPPGSDVYIVECISTPVGNKCTTGECSTDTVLLGNCNDLNYLQSKYQYQRLSFNGNQPEQSDFEGKVGPFIWKSELSKTLAHTFFGVGLSSTTAPEEGQNPTLQLATFYFPNSSESCTGSSFRWDPYGRVFDSVSLEPIPNVSVTLFSKVNDVSSQVNLPGITNPQMTGLEGGFNFVVPDGTYTLFPQISTHTYPNDPQKLNQAWSRLYADIYRGEDIIQKGFIQHRDIPVDPIGAPFTTPVRTLDYFIILDKLNSKLIIEGSSSHPLSIVKVYSGDTFLKEVTATKYGVFKIILDNATIDQSLPIRIISSRSDFAASQLLGKSPLFEKIISSVYAQNEDAAVVFSPIMNNIDGYAFDTNGNTVANATVTVFLNSSDNPFYKVSADNLGYFYIASQNLPPLPYYLEIKSPGGTKIKQTTSEFASFNAKFAKASSVNYGIYNPQAPGTSSGVNAPENTTSVGQDGTLTRSVISSDGTVVNVSVESEEITSVPEEGQIGIEEKPDRDYVNYPGANIIEGETSPKKSNLFVFIFILVFILISLFFYFRKNRRPKSR